MMTILGFVFIAIGAMVALVYGIILVTKAFQTSVVWGLAYLFVPFGAFVFLIAHWDEAGKPFLMSMLSLPLLLIGFTLLPTTETDGEDFAVPAESQEQETPVPVEEERVVEDAQAAEGVTNTRADVAPEVEANGPTVPTVTEALVKPPAPAPVITPLPVAARLAVPVANAVGGDPAIITYIESLSVSGVRAAGANSRIVLNGKVYYPDSHVNLDLRLKIHAIHQDEVVFIDGERIQYRKGF